MQQKIQFIAAVMHDPDLLILDEPFFRIGSGECRAPARCRAGAEGAGERSFFNASMELAEKLCDDICMINKSEKVWMEVYARSKAVSAECRGAAKWRRRQRTSDQTLVAKSFAIVTSWRPCWLRVQPPAVIGRLVAGGADQQFELVEPS